MRTSIDDFLLDTDIRNWYASLNEKFYEDYYNPTFQIKVGFSFHSNACMISITKSDQSLVSFFPLELYEKLSDKEIIDYIIKKVWELINDN